ncbi:putative zinc-type alcohol dehydrogenase-like protein [Friedmanniella endophytica]|uniref:alcohol dehydrogenase (NADP(+)) n=1 Tax=Microlunatus kandeliicorticis TaxID=1759536 RepID=A0A7W3IQN2_9ACTN|nr:NAD(P)-dependent alcohol dehydrogenase [Microlunatus kandeliicorticis]MBA8793461.1 putative zinc-type alcohol dehydrogenase-like protein [Microlunatus kandeliicorticis]
MTTVTALSAPKASAPFERAELERREVKGDDVRIDIRYAGICHSDIHTVREEWGPANFPLTPGHEIIGTVTEVGPDVTKYAVGDTVGVGCFVNSCGECEACKDGEEQYCSKGVVQTYNSKDYDGTATQGGYSQGIVVREPFVVRVPDGVDLAATTPLLCAGITTYAPLKRYGAGPGQKVGVIGLGGLGHVAVKIAAALGAEVSVLSRTDAKADDGKAFGASAYYATEDDQVFEDLANHFDLIINTVGASVDLDRFFGLLGRGGVMVNVGAPSEKQSFNIFSLIGMRRSYAGSLVGGLAETQEMLDFCAEHGITATVEVIKADQVDDYYDKVVSGDVRYRAVIDTATI